MVLNVVDVKDKEQVPGAWNRAGGHNIYDTGKRTTLGDERPTE